MPAFESADGKLLTDSNAIAYYVANQQLRGNTEYERAEVLQWLGFAESEILPAVCAWVFPVLGIIQYNKQVSDFSFVFALFFTHIFPFKSFERAKEDIRAALTILNAYLLPRTYLVGERITLADISVACTLLNLYKEVLDPNFRKPFVNVNRWFTTLINQPQFKSVLGEVKLCQKVAEVDPKKFVQQQGGMWYL